MGSTSGLTRTQGALAVPTQPPRTRLHLESRATDGCPNKGHLVLGAGAALLLGLQVESPFPTPSTGAQARACQSKLQLRGQKAGQDERGQGLAGPGLTPHAPSAICPGRKHSVRQLGPTAEEEKTPKDRSQPFCLWLKNQSQTEP